MFKAMSWSCAGPGHRAVSGVQAHFVNGESRMTKQDLFAYQDTMEGVTKDIHDACAGMEISVMWDNGKLRMVPGMHTVKVWNNLGAVEFHIDHHDLLERGDAYKGFLLLIATRIKKELGV
jgi:hypothetical protein